MGKHAYLILAHKNFNQLKRLITLLDDPRNDIFVHVDAKARGFNPEDFKDTARAARLTFLPQRRKVNWGGVSIMRAELDLLEAATAAGKHDYYHLLSGMDLPIKPQDDIHDFFEANAGKEFLNYWPMKKATYSRFRYYAPFPEGEGKFHTHMLNNLVKGLQILLGIRINRGIDFKFGAQWFSITDALARYILSQRDWLEKTFRHTTTCDEIFLATSVWHSPFRDNLYVQEKVKVQSDIDNSNMRFIDWTRGESVRHPWTFRAGDKALLESVPHFWARKFDENVDSEIIDAVEQMCRRPGGSLPAAVAPEPIGRSATDAPLEKPEE